MTSADVGSQPLRDTDASAFHALVQAIESSDIVVADLAAAALGTVLNGIITGEGPTTEGRAHFSRSLDATDAAW